jgi:hypothetical protein
MRSLLFVLSTTEILAGYFLTAAASDAESLELDIMLGAGGGNTLAPRPGRPGARTGQ